MNKYTAVIPSKDIRSVTWCIKALRENAMFCGDIIVIWNGESSWVPENADNGHLMVITPKNKEVYSMFNEGVMLAKEKHVLLINDDMYVSKNFDQPWAYVDEEESVSEKSIVTWQVCEPGYVEVNRKNIEMNFGKDWDKFEQSNFEEFNQFYSTSDKPDLEVGLGWYMPVLFPKELFIREGMYPTDPPFPHPNDITFFDKLTSYNFFKINRVVYHFQRLSQRQKPLLAPNVDKLNLCCGNDIRHDYINHDVSGHELNFDLSDGTIPLDDGIFSEVLFRHALEHFRFEVGERILREIHRILKDGGLITVHVPDLALACQDFLQGFNQYTDCASPIKRLYGLNDSEQQIHKAGYTVQSLQALLENCGFNDVRLEQTTIPDEICMKGRK